MSPSWFEQAFADVALAKAAEGEETSLVMRLGRQELRFGSGRLVDTREGPNVHRAFDGIALIWKSASWDVRVRHEACAEWDRVLRRAGGFRRDLLGIYAVSPLPRIKGASIDIYYLGLDRDLALYDKDAGHETRHIIGTRLWGTRGAWDFNAEGGLHLD